MFSLQAPGLDFDENGLPKIPGTPQGCSVMWSFIRNHLSCDYWDWESGYSCDKDHEIPNVKFLKTIQQWFGREMEFFVIL
jgi:hypothetical protein